MSPFFQKKMVLMEWGLVTKTIFFLSSHFRFADFFNTPMQNSAAPHALGFRGFFRGSYSYHFHNFW